MTDAYATARQDPVLFRPRSWRAALLDVEPEIVAVLEDDAVSIPSQQKPGDRLVDRAAVARLLDGADAADDVALLRAFLVVQAWGAGVTGARTLRHTARAFAHREQLVDALRVSAERLRRADATAELAEAYDAWRCPGVGPSFFTKWFAYAGRRNGRNWQPLILDARVYRALNITLGVRLVDLAGSRSRADRYRAYVEAVHDWARVLTVPAEYLEWVLFRDNGSAASS
ncbi:8-oxoguanine DNA glycosylase OGG fold protein [Cellulomonas sp. P4]|uniref:8-oxoguanine DNA glycosylase OGG fold protein n=1 Tax=Cellulomonas sp. P4 TaxID=3142533 RepID=UPI0031BAB801